MDDSDSPLSSPLSSVLSSPLSMRSRSPTPPCGYPSPSSTQENGSRSSSVSRNLQSAMMDSDGPPPAKKRKLFEPKKRTTEYLDLGAFGSKQGAQKDEDEIQLQRLMKAIHKKQKIVVIAGAGISVSAGIPDFRSSTGLFTTLRSQHKLKASGKHLFDASVYKNDDSTTSFHSMVRELSHLTRNATPTPFHHMLATLAEEGRLLRLYSQNVDGIDTALQPLATNVPLNPKGPWPKTIQLHGGLEKMQCTKCGTLSDFEGILFEGPEPPSCKDCEEMDRVRTTVAGKRSHGIGRLRPRMVLYNEFNPDEEAIGAVSAADLRSRPDAVIVVGTSLKVPGVRRIASEMCKVTRGRRDGFTAWINQSPEPMGIEFKDCWDLVVRGACDEVAQFASLPKWDDKDIGIYRDVTVEEIAGIKATRDVKIELPAVDPIHKAVERTQGMVTPTASPRKQSPAPLRTVPRIQLKFNPPNKNSKTASKAPPADKKKPTKTTTKKSKAKTKAEKPSNSITKAFGISKNTLPSYAKKNLKVEPQGYSTPAQAFSHVFPNLGKTCPSLQQRDEPSSSPMQPIPACDFRHNSDASSQLQLEQAMYNEAKANLTDTPYKTVNHESGLRETISPKSIPRGLVGLLD